MAEQIGINHARFSGAEINAATGTQSDFRDDVCGVQTDSRRIEKGNLFVALRGEKFDGHKFLQQVANQGAVAALVEEEQQNVDLPQIVVSDTLKALGDLARFHRQRFDIPVVAVTGSYGKTSTRALIEAGFNSSNVLASKANFNNEIGLPMTLLGLEARHYTVILEMGMRGRGQIDYLAKIALPTIGVITNIGPQHIELLGSLENIALAKAELIENLPADGLAVLPADSPFLPMLKSKAKCKTVTFGKSKNADMRAHHIESDANGNVSFCAIADWYTTLPFPGKHNAVNAVAALAVFDSGYYQLGVSLENAFANLHKAQLPGARMRVIKTEQLTIIDDCYNAGPDSMRAALETLRDFPSNGRRVAVLGAMRELGEFSDDEHRKLGELAGEICDFVVGVGPETEPMMDAIRDGGKCQLFAWSPAADAATPVVLAKLQRGDVVLVKGSRSVGLEVVVEELRKI